MHEKNDIHLLERLAQAVVELDKVTVKGLSARILEAGLDPRRAVAEGLTEGMRRAGERYRQGDYYVPEVLVAADAMEAGLQILSSALEALSAEEPPRGSVLICTAQGDIHEIGKNIVRVIFRAHGFRVKDLGVNVSVEQILEEQAATHHDIVGISCFLSTSAMGVPDAIKRLKRYHPDTLVMLGGAAVNAEVASSFGADGYADSAIDAAEEALRLLADRRLVQPISR
jgi:methylmalonyl-CoA mutase cobalamin-binding domain/chain